MSCVQYTSDEDPVVSALGALVTSLRENEERLREIAARAEEVLSQHQAGRSWTQVVRDERAPRLVELMSQTIESLRDSGARLRRAEAQALHREGLTIQEIGRLFGVSRQRVSALLHRAARRAAATPLPQTPPSGTIAVREPAAERRG